ncbi:Fic family protein [Gelidibacter maritimus]|uniref:Fic family protein n=1 Tax=Gelidibacter maritimus TaxID=2761487 RepID=A0A7W2M5J8_9FLAO|nr:Fic/DOC family N-terminal domain-containing protein [Gelidibacter maritimus]MBA6153105.1 Fic family protein [Gelidibacter maritimus]
MKPYIPHTLPIEAIEWHKFIDLMGKANRYIARYDGLLQSVINPDVLLAPLRTQEAVHSSKIEGTQASLRDVLQFEGEQDVEDYKKDDIYEVINYRIALKEGREQMQSIPLTLNLIRKMHNTLMHDVRGSSADPGNFRRIQNFIGAPGSTIDDARFVPPTVPVMMEALSNWEKYMHHEELDVIVQLAIVHAQFEIIHPFLDGNGRMGRILIPLFLYHKKIIHEPVFYLSDYLENHRSEYYDALKNITDSGVWTNWIRFFLNAIIVQAEKNINKTRAIINLYEEVKKEIIESTHSQYAVHCLDTIFIQPIFSSNYFSKNSGIPKSSTTRLLDILVKEKVLVIAEAGAGRRPTIYAFKRLLSIVND